MKVIKPNIDKDIKSNWISLCQCHCGKEFSVINSNIKYTKSCGCSRLKINQQPGRYEGKHGNNSKKKDSQ